jgi:carbonic anhydrase/acetyltransferase-like protein (isoleucine patch superfamily)
MIRAYKRFSPRLHPTAYVSETALAIGRVQLAAGTSLWPGAILRADVDEILVGEGSNLQDGVMVHVNYDLPAVIGRGVTVGHGAIVHGCHIGDNCLIGMGAILLDGAIIEDDCLIGAGALVPERKRIPAGHLVLGVPGKILRKLTKQEISRIRKSADEYREFARIYREQAG